jgi:hypothetical protein
MISFCNGRQINLLATGHALYHTSEKEVLNKTGKLLYAITML